MHNQLLENKSEIEKSKFDIEIDHIDFNDQTFKRGETLKRTLRIENTGNEKRVIKSVFILQGENPLFKIMPKDEYPFEIEPKKSTFIDLTINLRHTGVMKTILTFEFEGFGIGRFINVICGDQSI